PGAGERSHRHARRNDPTEGRGADRPPTPLPSPKQEGPGATPRCAAPRLVFRAGQGPAVRCHARAAARERARHRYPCRPYAHHRGGTHVSRVQFRLLCLAVVTCLPLPAGAQSAFDKLILAQATAPAPRRAQPIPNKPVSEEEAAKAARINNWTVGLAGGLLEGTFSKYAADLGKALDDGDNLRVLPIISYG